MSLTPGWFTPKRTCGRRRPAGVDGVDVLWHLGSRCGVASPTPLHQPGRDPQHPRGRPGALSSPHRPRCTAPGPTSPADHRGPLPRPKSCVPVPSQKLQAERICAETAPTVSLRSELFLGTGMDADVRKPRSLPPRRPGLPWCSGSAAVLHEDDAGVGVLAAVCTVWSACFNVRPGRLALCRRRGRVAGSRGVRLPYRVVVKGSSWPSGWTLTFRSRPVGADQRPLALILALVRRVSAGRRPVDQPPSSPAYWIPPSAPN